MKRGYRVLSLFFSDPFMWLSFLWIVILEWSFMTWFRPPLMMKVVTGGMGIVLWSAWPILFFQSNRFRKRYHRMSYESSVDELEKNLDLCSESFRNPARDCLALLSNIRQEFKSQIFQNEMDLIFQNLFDLSRNHGQLYSRIHQFGTKQQKQTMQSILQQQVTSVENSLMALKTFSGHLTLLEVQPLDYEKIGSDLKAINQGLQEAIQEMRDEEI